MLLIVCALSCEARPLIHHFRLKSVFQSSPFPIYASDQIFLIVSGVGKVQAAAATSYLQMLAGNQINQAWLNIGIAGHETFELGQAILAHKVIDQGSGRCYYPVFVINRPVSTAIVQTVERVELH